MTVISGVGLGLGFGLSSIAQDSLAMNQQRKTFRGSHEHSFSDMYGGLRKKQRGYDGLGRIVAASCCLPTNGLVLGVDLEV